MQRMQCVAACGIGCAHETHFAPVIFGNADQQEAQQDAVRSRHGSSRSQATHHDGRTICNASRPTNDNAFAMVLRTRAIVARNIRIARGV